IQGGGHSFFYVAASLIVGLIAGFLGSRMANQTVFPSAGFSAIVGACMEIIQMIFIFFFSDDLSHGTTLVRFIALPMILL
ncbi:LytS/YhcK type 5TM receptor domain-containing protein, partial [Enterococcus faecalis]|uniref:LytS/YhcK type 5TM receptor domain-containing protein n=1 Tax=Enterococcus faecalis TaxID=1351 RepID=UPI003D6A490E